MTKPTQLLALNARQGPRTVLVAPQLVYPVTYRLLRDTTDYSIPYLTSWSQDDDALAIIEACAALIDRHAKRIEDAIGDPI